MCNTHLTGVKSLVLGLLLLATLFSILWKNVKTALQLWNKTLSHTLENQNMNSFFFFFFQWGRCRQRPFPWTQLECLSWGGLWCSQEGKWWKNFLLKSDAFRLGQTLHTRPESPTNSQQKFAGSLKYTQALEETESRLCSRFTSVVSYSS